METPKAQRAPAPLGFRNSRGDKERVAMAIHFSIEKGNITSKREELALSRTVPLPSPHPGRALEVTRGIP